MAYRLRAQVPKESDVLSSILDALAWQQAMGKVAWYGRFNGGAFAVGDKRWFQSYRLFVKYGEERTKGFSDVHGMLTTGQPFYIEVKRPGGKKQADQEEFIDLAQENGAIAGFAENVEEALDLIMRGFDAKD